MQTVDMLLREAEIAHGHLCAGQILGVRMAMLGCSLLGIDDPRGLESPADRKRLVTFVEIDRCATDAIAVVTGCRLGKRALKFRDWGKMAATFVDLGSPVDLERAARGEARAIRIAARESSKGRAREMYPEMTDKNQAQMRAYREMADEEMFAEEWVSVPLDAREMPGYKSARMACAECGEGINYDREVVREGRLLCLGCADRAGRYYRVVGRGGALGG